MKRDYVMLNGVRISRAQYDELTAQFNEPELPKVGDVFLFLGLGHCARLVVDKHRNAFYAENGTVQGMSKDPREYKRVGTLSEIVAFYCEEKGI